MAMLQCPDCGKKLLSYGERHQCRSTSSGGGVERSSGDLSPTRSVSTGAVDQIAGVTTGPLEAKPKFDRAAYQRDYMKKYLPGYRARKKKAPQG